MAVARAVRRDDAQSSLARRAVGQAEHEARAGRAVDGQHRKAVGIAEFRIREAAPVRKTKSKRGAILGGCSCESYDGVHRWRTRVARCECCAPYSHPMMMSPGLIIKITGLPS